MATLTPLKPNSNILVSAINSWTGGTSGWTDGGTGGTGTFADLNGTVGAIGASGETGAAPLLNHSSSNITGEWGLTATDSDFGSLDTLVLHYDAANAGTVGDDTGILTVRIRSAGGTDYVSFTTLHDWSGTAWDANGAPAANKTKALTISAAGLAASKADWDAAEVNFFWTHGKVKGSDSAWPIILIDFELTGTYTAASSDRSGAGSATSNSSGVGTGVAAPYTHTVALGNWRFYSDATPDGSMVALAAENVAPTLVASEVQNGMIRLRAQIVESGGNAGSGAITVEYGMLGEPFGGVIEIDRAYPNQLEEGKWFRYGNGAAAEGATVGSQLLTGSTESGIYIEDNDQSASVGASATHELDIALFVHWPPPDALVTIRIKYAGVSLGDVTLNTSSIADRTRTVRSLPGAFSDGGRNSEIRFAMWERFFTDSNGRHWFFTLDDTASVADDISYQYWDGPGNEWSAVSLVAMTGDMESTFHSMAMSPDGTKVYIYNRASGSTQRFRRGVISGTTITWDAEQSLTQSTDRFAIVGVDDSGVVWIAGKTASTGMWVRRGTSADSVSAWDAVVNIASSGVVSGDPHAIVGLAANKCLVVWWEASTGDLLSCVVTGASAGTVRTISADAHSDDWGITRSNGWVYASWAVGAADDGSRRLSAMDETGDTWAACPNPGDGGAGDTGSNDGLPLAADGDDVYFFGVYSGQPEGGQDRTFEYRKYSGPGTTGTWDGSRTVVRPASEGNLDYSTAMRNAGNGRIIAGSLAGDDTQAGTTYAMEYYYIALSADKSGTGSATSNSSATQVATKATSGSGSATSNSSEISVGSKGAFGSASATSNSSGVGTGAAAEAASGSGVGTSNSSDIAFGVKNADPPSASSSSNSTGVGSGQKDTSGSGATTSNSSGVGSGQKDTSGSGVATSNSSGVGTGTVATGATGSGSATSNSSSVASGQKGASGSGSATSNSSGVGTGVAAEAAAGSGSATSNSSEIASGQKDTAGSGSATSSSSATQVAAKSTSGSGSATSNSSGVGSGVAAEGATGVGVGTSNSSGTGSGQKDTAGSGSAASNSSATQVAAKSTSGSGAATSNSSGVGTGVAAEGATGVGVGTSNSSGTASGQKDTAGSGAGTSNSSGVGSGVASLGITGSGSGTSNSTSVGSGQKGALGSAAGSSDSSSVGQGIKGASSSGSATSNSSGVGSGVQASGATGVGVGTSNSSGAASGQKDVAGTGTSSSNSSATGVAAKDTGVAASASSNSSGVGSGVPAEGAAGFGVETSNSSSGAVGVKSISAVGTGQSSSSGSAVGVKEGQGSGSETSESSGGGVSASIVRPHIVLTSQPVRSVVSFVGDRTVIDFEET